MKSWLFCFLLTSSLLCATNMRLSERLAKAKNHDYIVAETGKMATILAIRSVSADTLILEEISVPLYILQQQPTSIHEWVQAKAPGHSSWSMLEIDLHTGQVLECYSFSRASWLHISPKESLIATLLQLPLKPIPSDKRRKIGPAPMPGELDIRKEWNPPLTYEGQKIESARFDVFEAIWPQDDSEIAGQEVCLYFDHEKRFPLPFWIQVQTSHIAASLRVIDAGKNLPIIHRTLPRRVPEFVGAPIKTKEGITLLIKSPKYYRNFELFAIDASDKEKHILPVSHSIVSREEESLTLLVTYEELTETLQSNQRYTWLLVPVGYSESYTQSFSPFTWNFDQL